MPGGKVIMKLRASKGAVIKVGVMWGRERVFIGKVHEIYDDEVVLWEQDSSNCYNSNSKSVRQTHIWLDLIAWWQYANIEETKDYKSKREKKLSNDYVSYDENGFCYGDDNDSEESKSDNTAPEKLPQVLR